MSPILEQEYAQLTDWQKTKFHELVQWQTKGVKGPGMSDLGCLKIVEWVKRMVEPPAPPAEPEESPQE